MCIFCAKGASVGRVSENATAPSASTLRYTVAAISGRLHSGNRRVSNNGAMRIPDSIVHALARRPCLIAYPVAAETGASGALSSCVRARNNSSRRLSASNTVRSMRKH